MLLFECLLTLDGSETRLPAIDRLEGFRPGGPCLYRRVLVPVCMNRGRRLTAWVYVAGSNLKGRFKSLSDGTWR